MSALLTADQVRRLTNNGTYNALRVGRGKPRMDFRPVAHLVNELTGREWLLFEIDANDAGLVYAECRRSGRAPEKVWLRLTELAKHASRPRTFGRIAKARIAA